MVIQIETLPLCLYSGDIRLGSNNPKSIITLCADYLIVLTDHFRLGYGATASVLTLSLSQSLITERPLHPTLTKLTGLTITIGKETAHA